MRPEVQKYVKKKYAAAKGGGVPADDDDELDDVPEETEPSEREEASPVPDAPDAVPDESETDDEEDAETPAAPSSPAVSGKPDEAALRDYLTKKYGDAADDTKVQEAREDRTSKNRILAIGEGLEGIARSKAQAYGGAGVNHASYDSARASAGQGVADAQADRQAKIQGFLQQQALEQHATKTMLDRGTIAQKEQARAYAQAANTPGSPVSIKAAQDFNAIYPEYAVDPKTATAAHVEAFAKQVAAKRTTDAKFDANETRRVIAGENAHAHASEAAARAGDKADKADQKTTADQEKAYTEYRAKMSGGGKGVPKNVQNALVAKTNIAAAKELVAKAGGPDNMNEKQVQLFTEELAKIATGGVPAEATMHHLNPDTFQQHFNDFMSKVKGSPQPADVGNFIRDNQKYLDGLEDITNGVVGKYQADTHKAYKRRLSPDQLAEAETDYPEATGKGAPKAAAPASVAEAPPQPAAAAAPAAQADLYQSVLAEQERRKALKGGTAIGSK